MAAAKSALMPIDKSFSPLRARDLGGEREMRPRRFLERRNAHQPGNRQAVFVAAGGEKRIGVLRQHAGLLRLGAGIDLDEQQRRDAPAWRSPSPAPRTGSAGRPNEWRRTAPPPPWPCWIAAGRSDAARVPACFSSSGGHLALASCTRFSPNTRWPASITGSIASAPNVFDTAISVTSAGSRPASRQARAISARTLARPVVVERRHGEPR